MGIISQLLVERAHITISDPKALSNAAAHFGNAVTYEIDPYRAAKNSHAVIMLTDWSVFKELDYAEIYQSMKKPAYIFDGRNIIDCRKCKEIGFEVYSIGKG